MKRLIGLIMLFSTLLFPCAASAGKTGIYIAPKFIYAPTQIQGAKVSGTEVESGVDEKKAALENLEVKRIQLSVVHFYEKYALPCLVFLLFFYCSYTLALV